MKKVSCNVILTVIEQLTSIWLANQRMRPSMHSLMNKCRACLELMANNEDTTAISQLIIYYTEGIELPKTKLWPNPGKIVWKHFANR